MMRKSALSVNELKNRYLHVANETDERNVAIDTENIAIRNKNIAIDGFGFNIQTKTNIKKLYEIVGGEMVFGRSDVSDICEISYSTAGSLISKMRKAGLIEDVNGYGKGKYRFCRSLLRA